MISDTSLKAFLMSPALVTGSPSKYMAKMLRGHITRFTEYRVNSLPFLATLTGLPLYHTYSVLEINNGDFQILFERCLSCVDRQRAKRLVCFHDENSNSMKGPHSFYHF